MQNIYQDWWIFISNINHVPDVLWSMCVFTLHFSLNSWICYVIRNTFQERMLMLVNYVYQRSHLVRSVMNVKHAEEQEGKSCLCAHDWLGWLMKDTVLHYLEDQFPYPNESQNILYWKNWTTGISQFIENTHCTPLSKLPLFLFFIFYFIYGSNICALYKNVCSLIWVDILHLLFF